VIAAKCSSFIELRVFDDKKSEVNIFRNNCLTKTENVVFSAASLLRILSSKGNDPCKKKLLK